MLLGYDSPAFMLTLEKRLKININILDYEEYFILFLKLNIPIRRQE